MLQTHDLVPHFAVTDVRGERVEYSGIWQRRNLVLVALPASDPASGDYVERLSRRAAGPDEDDTQWLATHDPIVGVPSPGVVVADRWGEVVHVAHAAQVADLPAPESLAEWVHYVQQRCPECEGEAR